MATLTDVQKKDIEFIVSHGGGDNDVLDYLRQEGVSFEEPDRTPTPFGLERLGIAAKKTGKETAQIASTMAFGIPQAVLHRFAPRAEEAIFPKNPEIGSQLIGFSSGGASKLASMTGRAVLKSGATIAKGGKLGLRIGNIAETATVGLGKGASVAERAKGVITARKLAVANNRALAATLEGGVFGATQLDVEPTVGKQAGHAALLAIGFRGLNRAGQFLSEIGRTLNKRGIFPKILGGKGMKKSNVTPLQKARGTSDRPGSVKEAADAKLKSLERGKQTATNRVEDKIQELRAKKSQSILDVEAETSKIVDEVTPHLESGVKNAKAVLKQSTESTALRIKGEINKFNKSASDAYGKALNQVSDDLVAKGETITMQEADGIFGGAVSRMDEALIKEGRPRALVDRLADKYRVRNIGEPSRFGLSSSGVKPTALRSNASDPIDFAEFVKDIRSVRQAGSGAMKTGSKRAEPDDVAISILENSFGDFVATRVPSFGKLQSSYKPIIETMSKAHKLFKPRSGARELDTGARNLERIATGKDTPDLRNTLSDLERGANVSGVDTTFKVKPIENVSKELKLQGKDLARAEERLKSVIRRIQTTGKTRKAIESNRIDARLNELTKNKEFIQASFDKKQMLIKDTLAKRLKELGLRDEQVKLAMQDRKQFFKITSPLRRAVTIAAEITILRMVFGSLLTGSSR